jgi:hypothetical protein
VKNVLLVKALGLQKLYYPCLFSIALLFIASTYREGLAMDSNLPGPEERLKAIGPMAGLPETLRLALDPGTDFAPIPPPKPGDWLAAHPEPGQSFEEFVRLPHNLLRDYEGHYLPEEFQPFFIGERFEIFSHRKVFPQLLHGFHPNDCRADGQA